MICGHLIFGDLDRGVGYIVPAAQTFQEMKSQGNPNLAVASPSPIIPENLETVLSSPGNTLVGSPGPLGHLGSLHSGPSLLGLDEVIRSEDITVPEGSDIPWETTVHELRNEDLEHGMRWRPVSKAYSSKLSRDSIDPPPTPTEPKLRTRKFKPFRFWIDQTNVLNFVSLHTRKSPLLL